MAFQLLREEREEVDALIAAIPPLEAAARALEGEKALPRGTVEALSGYYIYWRPHKDSDRIGGTRHPVLCALDELEKNLIGVYDSETEFSIEQMGPNFTEEDEDALFSRLTSLRLGNRVVILRDYAAKD